MCNCFKSSYEFQDSCGLLGFIFNTPSIFFLYCNATSQRKDDDSLICFPLARIAELIELILCFCFDCFAISFYLEMMKQQQQQQQLLERSTKDSLKEKQGWL